MIKRVPKETKGVMRKQRITKSAIVVAAMFQGLGREESETRIRVSITNESGIWMMEDRVRVENWIGSRNIYALLLQRRLLL